MNTSAAAFITVLAILCLWLALPLLGKQEAKEQTLDGEQEAVALSHEEH